MDHTGGHKPVDQHIGCCRRVRVERAVPPYLIAVCKLIADPCFAADLLSPLRARFFKRAPLRAIAVNRLQIFTLQRCCGKRDGIRHKLLARQYVLRIDFIISGLLVQRVVNRLGIKPRGFQSIGKLYIPFACAALAVAEPTHLEAGRLGALHIFFDIADPFCNGFV